MKANIISLVALKKRGRQTDESSEALFKRCLKNARSDLPPFFNYQFSFMRAFEKKGQKSFNDFVKLHGKKQLSKSLNQLHDWVLYDSSLVIDQEKKDVLHDVKLLANHLRR